VHAEIISAELRASADKHFRRLDKAFGDAVRSRKRSAITEVLLRAQLSEELARRTAEKILATVRRERAMPLCGGPISREHSARTSGSVTLRREVEST
jgi:hypothetical protein